MKTTRVLIAGAGVAAIEAMLALRSLAGDLVEIELLGPEPHFWYRPLSVAEPFGLGKATRYEVGALAAAGGGTFTLGTLQRVDALRHVATTTVGEIAYDSLLVAVGAVPTQAVPGALTFRGPADDEKIRGLLDELREGTIRRVAFAVPSGACWPLPIYELALLTASQLHTDGIDEVELALVTPEEKPLEVFGRAGTAAVRRLLEERLVALHTGAAPVGHTDGELRLADGRTIEADRVVTLPRLQGPRLDGLPRSLDGFIPIDVHARVEGRVDVYAAGDSTNFPVKQGGIATQLADAAAVTIAAQAGANVEPEPFRPVLRALLLTGTRTLYLRRALPGAGRVTTMAPGPSRRLPAKIRGRYLEPFLATVAGTERSDRDSDLPAARR